MWLTPRSVSTRVLLPVQDAFSSCLASSYSSLSPSCAAPPCRLGEEPLCLLPWTWPTSPQHSRRPRHMHQHHPKAKRHIPPGRKALTQICGLYKPILLSRIHPQTKHVEHACLQTGGVDGSRRVPQSRANSKNLPRRSTRHRQAVQRPRAGVAYKDHTQNHAHPALTEDTGEQRGSLQDRPELSQGPNPPDPKPITFPKLG